MVQDSSNGFKQGLLWAGGVLATIGTACQIAGVTSVLLANVCLIFGVWIFTGAEVWFSRWIRNTGRYKNCIVVAITSIAGCTALLISSWIEAQKAQQDATSRNSGISFINLDLIDFAKGYSTLKAGAEVKVNSFYTQHGPEPLHNVTGITSTLYIENPGSDADLRAKSIFLNTLSRFKANHSSDSWKGADLEIGQSQWTTASIPIADQSGVDAILDGRIRLYVFGWETWTDMEERTSDKTFCRWMQRPFSVNLSIKEVVWHNCILE